MKITSRMRVVVAVAAVGLLVPAMAWGITSPTLNFFGSTDRGTSIDVSEGGNIVGFGGPVVAGASYEHVNVGALSDGYVLCYRNPQTGTYVNAYDVGTAASGFGPATATPDPNDPNVMRVVRSTSDGLLGLKQGFAFQGKEKRMLVQMDVINSNPFPIEGVVLRRQADFDVDSGGPDGWAYGRNFWARTSRDSVFAWTDPSFAGSKEAHGMLMTHRASHVHQSGVYTEIPASARTAKVTENPLDTSCSPPAKSTPLASPTDDGGTIEVRIGTIAAAPSPGTDTRAAVAVWYQRL